MIWMILNRWPSCWGESCYNYSSEQFSFLWISLFYSSSHSFIEETRVVCLKASLNWWLFNLSTCVYSWNGDAWTNRYLGQRIYLPQHYMQLNTPHYWHASECVSRSTLLQSASSVATVATCCCRSLLVQVSLHYALFHRVGALPVILNPFILLMYQVLLHKVQTSHVVWNQLWQPGVTSCLGSLDWQVICQPDSGHGVCVFVDFCDANVQTLSTANMSFP